MAWYESMVKGKKPMLDFPECHDEEWTREQYKAERQGLIDSVKELKPATIFHGWIVKSCPISDLRMAIVVFKDDPKKEVRCTLAKELEERWWWYGHLGTDGETQASEVKYEVSEVTMDDLLE